MITESRVFTLLLVFVVLLVLVTSLAPLEPESLRDNSNCPAMLSLTLVPITGSIDHGFVCLAGHARLMTPT